MRIPGFRFAGVSAGVKKATSRRDIGLIVADHPAVVAASFTKNRVVAAPVIVSREHVRRGLLRGVVAQSGNANACTGERGLADARAMCARAAAGIGAAARDFAVASTGVIGFPLPMDRVSAGIDAAVAALSPDAWEDFSEAILTTDRGPKRFDARLRVGGAEVVVAGCAKGAGMIGPNMATTLAFVCTDAAVSGAWLRKVVKQEVEATFNSVTVDGDTSTNDSLFVLASGAAGNTVIRDEDSRPAKALRVALREVLLLLATSLVRDGEGATKVVEIVVEGARSEEAARRVARRIANSPLVKTAIGGADPNWGRILAAAGASGVPLDPDKLDLDIGDVPVVRRGAGVHAPSTEQDAHAVMSRPEYAVRLNLRQGKARASYYTCDLTHDYVRINADYRS